MYVRSKVIKGHTYYYLVEGRRTGKTVRQRVIKYLGKYASAPAGSDAPVRRPPEVVHTIQQAFSAEESERIINQLYEQDIRTIMRRLKRELATRGAYENMGQRELRQFEDQLNANRAFDYGEGYQLKCRLVDQLSREIDALFVTPSRPESSPLRPLGTAPPSIPPALEPLAEEARKYESAESFQTMMKDFAEVEAGRQKLINPEGYETYQRLKKIILEYQRDGGKDMSLTDFYHQAVSQQVSAASALTSNQWTREHDGAQMRVDVLKVDGGIEQKIYENGEEMMSTFSPRPYRLGQACDGTIDICVHALFIRWARAHDLDPQVLYNQAYPDKRMGYDVAQQEEILQEATAQGLEIPEQWGEAEFQGLITSLTEINNHSLVDVLLSSHQLGTTPTFLPRSFAEDSTAAPPSSEHTSTVVNRRRIKATIDEALNDLNAALAAGHSEALTSYLQAMARLRRYSFLNQMLIARQRPQASDVAGYREWKNRGRYVRKGERGILITAPITRRSTPDEPDTTEASLDAADNPMAYEIVGFQPVYVFDVSQTDGDPLPQPFQAAGDPQDYTDKLKALIAARGITLTYVAGFKPLGASGGGTIVLRDGLSPVEEFTTLVHELAHELLHHQPTPASKTVRETEAEAVSHMVSTAIGLDTTQATADYIHLYQGDPDTLYASLKAIRHTTNAILDGLDTTEGLGPGSSAPVSSVD